MKKKSTSKVISNQDFGIRLRKLRKEKNISQMDLAEKLHTSRSSIANWETGIRFPDYLSVKRIAVIFGVSVDYLYGLSNYRYKINIPDYFEMDFTTLNDAGINFIHEVYKLLQKSEKYRADKE